MSDEQGEKRTPHGELLRMTTDVVAAYLGKNDLPADQIPNVINTVFGSLRDLDGGSGEIKSEPPTT